MILLIQLQLIFVFIIINQYLTNCNKLNNNLSNEAMFQNPDLIIENFTSRQDIDNNSTNGKKLTIKINNPDDDDPCDERCKEEYQKLLQMLDGMANKRVEQDLLDVIKLNKLNVTRHNDFITGIWELLWNTPSKVIKFTIIQAFYLYLASLGKARLGDLLDWSGNVIVPGHNDPRTTEKIIRKPWWHVPILFGKVKPQQFDENGDPIVITRKFYLMFIIFCIATIYGILCWCGFNIIFYEQKWNSITAIRFRGQEVQSEQSEQ